MRLRAANLVANGYFPRELPPPFATTQLGSILRKSPNKLPALPKKKTTACVQHNLARIGGLRRPLGVPNPQAYVDLCRAIELHWMSIDEHLQAQDVSRSRPIPSNKEGRSIRPLLAMRERPKLRARARSGIRYLMLADISQFYSSIYTHSIPWALHTKAVAKKVRSNFGDDLDRCLRKLMRDQTAGIPIGPDSSLIIAEILLAAIDAQLGQTVDLSRGFRYIDDFEFGFRTIGDAETALVTLDGVLTDFELRLNPTKTEIVEVPQPFQELWVSNLHAFPIRQTSAEATIADVIALFSQAALLAQANPRHGVLRYALNVARDAPISRHGWRVFEGLILSAASADPTSFPVALDLLDGHSQRIGTTISKLAMADVLEAQIARHAPLKNASEVAWALWAALRFRIRLSQRRRY